MQLETFDEGRGQRVLCPHDSRYGEIFRLVRDHVVAHLDSVELFHIGSTAVPDLWGKPMVDIIAVSTAEDLRTEQMRFEQIGLHRRAVWTDTDDKPYVCASLRLGGCRYNVNIHICRERDPVCRESLEFVEILKGRPDLRRRYEEAKERAHAVAPADAEAYNREKASIIREILRANGSDG